MDIRRLMREHKELNKKIKELHEDLIKKDLSVKALSLMTAQYYIMLSYEELIEDRIELAKKELKQKNI